MAPEVSNVLSDDEYEKSIQNIRTLYDEYMKVGREIMEAYYKNEDEAVNKYGELDENNDTNEQVERLDKIKELINKEGSTLLHNAIYKNDYNNVMFLIGQKADLNKEDENGLIPVKVALKQKKFAIADYLLMNLNKSVKDNIKIEDVEISLMEAAKNGWFHIITMLIGKIDKKDKTAYINVQDEYGNTPLLYSTHLHP